MQSGVRRRLVKIKELLEPLVVNKNFLTELEAREIVPDRSVLQNSGTQVKLPWKRHESYMITDETPSERLAENDHSLSRERSHRINKPHDGGDE